MRLICRCTPKQIQALRDRSGRGGGFSVNRAQQVEHLDDAFRAQVEMFANQGESVFLR